MKRFLLVCLAAFVPLAVLPALELELGLASGATVWNDAVGFAAAPECRMYLLGPASSGGLALGAQVRYDLTSSDDRSQNEVYGLILASYDFVLARALALRTQLALGGGWLGADGSAAVSTGAGVLVPQAGVLWSPGSGRLALSLLAGTQTVYTPAAWKNTICVSLGAAWRLGSAAPHKERDQ